MSSLLEGKSGCEIVIPNFATSSLAKKIIDANREGGPL